MKWAIFDLDGTVCNVEHRVHLAHARDYDAFHARHMDDEPYEAIVDLAQAWMDANRIRVCDNSIVDLNKHAIAYMTGRLDSWRHTTRLWLRRYALPGAMTAPLLMRSVADHRPAVVVKPTMLDLLRKEYFGVNDTISFFVEDQDDLVAMWRAKGYTCLQPRLGSFT